MIEVGQEHVTDASPCESCNSDITKLSHQSALLISSSSLLMTWCKQNQASMLVIFKKQRRVYSTRGLLLKRNPYGPRKHPQAANTPSEL
ncbi:hypothetical protein MAM1_0032d02430 [Mucor ambiguus]|uniref:Uncharacterized protein n=1 Tax=Mucor ambiguus TaxID=91626 RepID=A0A0C9LSM9_9FUNG|nr:hypothetical protein MAM1_0032d02430 [Mucor ambiguus]